ncbi:MAG: XrtB/PEP-CTERM-associated polysaccharide biosynthesis outer membrane protein EpsL [Pseudomonadota bacterium]
MTSSNKRTAGSRPDQIARAVSSGRVLRLAAIPLALIASVSTTAQADEQDTLQFKAGQSFQHESNIFRAPNAQSDTVGVTTVGVKVDKSYSLQRFELEADANYYRYNNFSGLNFTAVNYAAAWRFAVTPKLRGNLTTDRREYIDTSVDQTIAGVVNRRTERSTLLDAEYELGAAWRLLGGVYERKTANSEPLSFEGDASVRGGEVGAKYVTAAGNSLAYRFKSGKGEYSNIVPGTLTGVDFNEREHELRGEYALTGRTTVRGRAAYLDREHKGAGSRDFSGLVGQIDANWAVTGKTTLSGGVARDLVSYQTNNESYYEGYRIFVGPTWKPTEKTAVRLRFEHGVRNFKGPLPGFASSGRRDTTNVAMVGGEWEVIRAVTLGASVQREHRNSNLPGLDYTNNIFMISALAKF